MNEENKQISLEDFINVMIKCSEGLIINWNEKNLVKAVKNYYKSEIKTLSITSDMLQEGNKLKIQSGFYKDKMAKIIKIDEEIVFPAKDEENGRAIVELLDDPMLNKVSVRISDLAIEKEPEISIILK